MKIAIDISQIAYPGTGVANYTENLVRNLLKIDQVNEYFLFASSLRQKTALEAFINSLTGLKANFKSKIFPFPQSLVEILANRLNLLSLERLVGKVDLYHSSDWIQLPCKARKITTVHDLVVFKYPEISHPRIIAVQKRRMAKVLNECQVILADSWATKIDLLKILKADENKITVVYPGIDEIFMPKSPEEIVRVKQQYDINGDYILTVGPNEPRKNLKRIIEGYRLFRKKAGNKKSLPGLVCAGNKGWGETMEIEVGVLNLGFVEKNDLPALYSGALFLIYAPLYEGFGLPVLEAMASGCPVISSNRGSLNELGNKDSLSFVNPENTAEISQTIFKVFNSLNLRRNLSQSGLQQAKKFSWEKSAEKILNIYNSLL